MVKPVAILIAALAQFGEPGESLSRQQVLCLAQAVYHEARSQPMRGQIMVAETVMARVLHSRYGDTPCQVIRERSQFPWYRKRDRIREAKAFYRSVEIAAMVMLAPPKLDVPMLFYNPKKVTPSWAKRSRVVAVVGDHIFLQETIP